jgi:hypothetical protein
MQRKNIPNYVLAKGISRDGFEQLLQDIRNAVMEEGVNEFSNYSELLNFIKEKDGADSEKWISEFEGQLTESVTIINENMAKIEGLFARIFADWEVYKEEHNIVEEKKEEEPVVEQNVSNEGSTDDSVKVEVPAEEVKVELEPVVIETSEKEEETQTKEEAVVESPEVPVEEETKTEVEDSTEEKTKKDKKSKKDKSETEGDNNG